MLYHKKNHLWYCKLGAIEPFVVDQPRHWSQVAQKRKSIAAAVCTDGEKHQKPNINLLKPVQPFSFDPGPGSVSVIPWRRCFSAKMFQLPTIISTMVLVPYLASTQKYSKWHFQYIWSPINQSSQGPKSIVKIRLFWSKSVWEKLAILSSVCPMTIMVASVLLKPTLVMFYGNKLFGVIAKFMQKPQMAKTLLWSFSWTSV